MLPSIPEIILRAPPGAATQTKHRVSVAAFTVVAILLLAVNGSYAAGKDDGANPSSKGLASGRVTGIARLTSSEFVIVRTTSTMVRATPEHPFYVRSNGWTKARDLAQGDVLDAREGTGSSVVSVTFDNGPRQAVYNLRVEGGHTFRVGAEGLLVHNDSVGRCVGMPARQRKLMASVVETEAPPFEVAKALAKENPIFAREPMFLADVPVPQLREYMDAVRDTPPARRPPLPEARLADAPGSKTPSSFILAEPQSHLLNGKAIDQNGSGIYKDRNGDFWGVSFYTDPSNVKDRALVDDLSYRYGVEAPAGQVVKRPDGTLGYAVRIRYAKGADPTVDRPEVVMVPGKAEPPLSGPENTKPRWYKAHVLMGRDTMPLKGFNVGHSGWMLEVPEPATGESRWLVGYLELGDRTKFSKPQEKRVYRGLFLSENDAFEELGRRAAWNGIYTYRSTVLSRTPADLQARIGAALHSQKVEQGRPFRSVSSTCVNYADCTLRASGYMAPREPSPNGIFGVAYRVPRLWYEYLGGATDAWSRERPIPLGPGIPRSKPGMAPKLD